jgi:hypothetical protein
VPSFHQSIRESSWRRRAKALVTTCLLVAFPALPLLAQETRAEYDSLVARTAVEDSTGPRGSLKRAIGSFESKWRKLWHEQQYGRHGRIDTSGILLDNRAREARVRRFWAVQCAQVTPYRNRGPHDTAPLRMHPVVTLPDRGAICPQWFPPDDKRGYDESESIDLALFITQRDSGRALRAELLAKLNAAQRKTPRDAWISGQLVRFWFDQRDTAQMLLAAERCRGEEWTCFRLRGFAAAKSGQLVEAERAFRKADSLERRVATKDDKCPSAPYVDLFDVYARAYWRDQSCEDQQELTERVWWLSDPLWSIAGSDRYVEHQVRRIHVELRAVRSNDERYVWDKYVAGASMRETILRYGWPSHTYWPGWQAERDIGLLMEKTFAPSLDSSTFRMAMFGGSTPLRIFMPPLTSKEYFPNRTALLPDFSAIRDPFSLTSAHYSLRNPDSSEPDGWWPNEHMWLPYTIAALDSGQSVMLRRDSTILYQQSIDDPLTKLDSAATGPSRAFLMGGTSERDTRELARAPIAKDYTLQLSATLASHPIVLSTEIQHRTNDEPALRSRLAVHPPPTLAEMRATDVAMSNPVFLRLPNREMELPTDEAEIRRYMAGSTQFSRNEVLAMYWESYGIHPGDTVHVELRIRRADDRSAARVIGSALGIAESLRDSVSIKWTEPDGTRTTKLVAARVPVIARAIALDVSAMTPGKYSVLIEMRKDSTVVRGERAFVVKEN